MWGISKSADDTKIGRVVNSEVECPGLQEDIDGMVKWVDKWQMEFNPQKCEVNVRSLGSSVKQRDLGVFVHRSLKAEGHDGRVVKKTYGTLSFYQLSHRLQKQGSHWSCIELW